MAEMAGSSRSVGSAESSAADVEAVYNALGSFSTSINSILEGLQVRPGRGNPWEWRVAGFRLLIWWRAALPLCSRVCTAAEVGLTKTGFRT